MLGYNHGSMIIAVKVKIIAQWF